MDRVIKLTGSFGQEDKYILVKEYEGWGIYQEKCPSGYFVHQSYLFTNGKTLVVCESYNNMCIEEILDAIDSYNKSGKFGIKCLNKGYTTRGNVFVTHPCGVAV